ncbi:hypothetical protein HYU96_00150 [Candidatus Daviesbacteria bacterium]|nr:hypothetical protein [Candidatus Daviesbacteria bacterium]
MLNRRVDILFDKDLWKKAANFSKAQKISAGELIRRAVKTYLDGQKAVQPPKQTPFNRLFKPRG